MPTKKGADTGKTTTFSKEATTTVSSSGGPFKWSDPEDAYKKKKISIEISGEQGIGKTHLACSFPKPAFLDTEHKGYVVLRKFANKRWFPAKNMQDARRFVEACLEDPEIETIVWDSGTDIQDWAEQELLAETGKLPTDNIWPRVQYKQVYRKIDEQVFKIVGSTEEEIKKNFIVTARVKDEYLNDQKTGRAIRDGYKKTPYQLQLMIQLEKGIRAYDGSLMLPQYIFGKVVKNGYIAPHLSKPYLINCTYEGILKELTVDYFSDEDTEEQRKEKWGKMVDDAEKASKKKPLITTTREGDGVRKDTIPGF